LRLTFTRVNVCLDRRTAIFEETYMADPVEDDGRARPWLRTYKADAGRVGDMARRFSVRAGRQVKNPAVVTALVAYGEAHEDEIFQEVLNRL
jgi:hypothetical protein